MHPWLDREAALLHGVICGFESYRVYQASCSSLVEQVAEDHREDSSILSGSTNGCEPGGIGGCLQNIIAGFNSQTAVQALVTQWMSGCLLSSLMWVRVPSRAPFGGSSMVEHQSDTLTVEGSIPSLRTMQRSFNGRMPVLYTGDRGSNPLRCTRTSSPIGRGVALKTQMLLVRIQCRPPWLRSPTGRGTSLKS